MPFQLPCLRHLSIQAGENEVSRVLGILAYEIDEDIMFIVEIAVSLKRARTATRLVEAALKMHDTVQHVQLIVKKDNEAARLFYKKLGFKEEKSHVGSHQPEDDQLYMSVAVDSATFGDEIARSHQAGKEDTPASFTQYGRKGLFITDGLWDHSYKDAMRLVDSYKTTREINKAKKERGYPTQYMVALRTP